MNVPISKQSTTITGGRRAESPLCRRCSRQAGSAASTSSSSSSAVAAQSQNRGTSAAIGAAGGKPVLVYKLDLAFPPASVPPSLLVSVELPPDPGPAPAPGSAPAPGYNVRVCAVCDWDELEHLGQAEKPRRVRRDERLATL